MSLVLLDPRWLPNAARHRVVLHQVEEEFRLGEEVVKAPPAGRAYGRLYRLQGMSR